MGFGEFWKVPGPRHVGERASRRFSHDRHLPRPWLAAAFGPHRLPAPDSGVVGGSRVRPSPNFPVPTHKKTHTDHLCPTTDSTREEVRGSKRKPLACRQPGGGLRPRPAAPQQPEARPRRARASARPPRPYLHRHAEVHHGHAGVAVPAYVHHGVAAVRGLALQRGARRTEVILRLLVARRLLRGLCRGEARRGADISALQEACRKAFPRLLSGGLQRCRQSLGNPPGLEVTL